MISDGDFSTESFVKIHDPILFYFQSIYFQTIQVQKSECRFMFFPYNSG